MSPKVSQLIQNHPLKAEIDSLRSLVLSVNVALKENVKWNGPNYTFKGEDRITIKINPPTKIQIIFHRGAKVQDPPAARLIDEFKGILEWKGNDRAVFTLKNMEDQKMDLINIIQQWISV